MLKLICPECGFIVRGCDTPSDEAAVLNLHCRFTHEMDAQEAYEAVAEAIDDREAGRVR